MCKLKIFEECLSCNGCLSLSSTLEEQNQKLRQQNKTFHEMIAWIKEAFGENINEDYGHFKLKNYIEEYYNDYDLKTN